MSLKTTIHAVNLPKHLCKWLLGKDHKVTHRLLVGTAVMVVGVLITKCSSLYDNHVFHLVVDVVGYGIHGLGLTPYIEALIEVAEESV